MTAENPWSSVCDYLLSYSTYYPNIATWCSKVGSELPTGRRTILALRHTDGEIAGLAVTKNRRDSKLCHFSVSERERTHGLGGQLMRAAALHMTRVGARRIHVTTSEEVAHTHGEFFERCGFSFHSVYAGRYRSGADELEWAASPETLLGALDCASSPPLCVSGERRLQPLLVSLVWIPYEATLRWVPETKEPAFGRRSTEEHASEPADGRERVETTTASGTAVVVDHDRD